MIEHYCEDNVKILNDWEEAYLSRIDEDGLLINPVDYELFEQRGVLNQGRIVNRYFFKKIEVKPSVEKRSYYHLHVFGKNWILHGKHLFETEWEALECLESARKASMSWWYPLEGEEVKEVLGVGYKLVRVDGFKCNNIEGMFKDKPFHQNDDLVLDLEPKAIKRKAKDKGKLQPSCKQVVEAIKCIKAPCEPIVELKKNKSKEKSMNLVGAGK